MKLVDNFTNTIQTSEEAVQHLPSSILYNCVRDKWLVNNYYGECARDFIFCKVEALRLELGERNKRLALTFVWEQLSVLASLLTDK